MVMVVVVVGAENYFLFFVVVVIFASAVVCSLTCVMKHLRKVIIGKSVGVYVRIYNSAYLHTPLGGGEDNA